MPPSVRGRAQLRVLGVALAASVGAGARGLPARTPTTMARRPASTLWVDAVSADTAMLTFSGPGDVHDLCARVLAMCSAGGWRHGELSVRQPVGTRYASVSVKLSDAPQMPGGVPALLPYLNNILRGCPAFIVIREHAEEPYHGPSHIRRANLSLDLVKSGNVYEFACTVWRRLGQAELLPLNETAVGRIAPRKAVRSRPGLPPTAAMGAAALGLLGGWSVLYGLLRGKPRLA